VALVSDAGTPGLSDPGTPMVQAAIQAHIPVVSLPGACAAITGLVASGLPTDRLFFIGFLPRRAARAKRALTLAAATEATVAIYESPYRTAETLKWIAECVGPETPVVIGRELTKVHEEFIRGTAAEIAVRMAETQPIGEIVIFFKKQP
jgi:16S rRNA (cytidine1402-2'-O)-methyltransferase